MTRRASCPSGPSGRQKLPQRPDTPPRVDWGPREVAANTRVDYVICSNTDRGQSRCASNLHGCHCASRREHLSDNRFHAGRLAILAAVRPRRAQTCRVSYVSGADGGVNRISAGVNRSKEVGPAAVCDFLMSYSVDTNLNIGAQGPQGRLLGRPRSYLTIVR